MAVPHGGHANAIDGDGHKPSIQPPPETTAKRKKHLYLVLDDTRNGISIHKLHVENLSRANCAAYPVPSPPVIRMESPSLGDYPVVAIVGSSIVGVGSGSPEPYCDFENRNGVTVALDTNTAVLTVHRDLPNGLREHCVVLAVAAGNRLYVMEDGGDPYDEQWKGGLHCLKVEDSVDGGPSTRSKQQAREMWHDYMRSPSRCAWTEDPLGVPFNTSFVSTA